MSFKILRLREVIEVTGLGRSTIYTKMMDDAFPKSVKLGALAVGWIDDEVYGWIKARKANYSTIEHRKTEKGL